MIKQRIIIGTNIIVVIALGLFTRKNPNYFYDFWATYAPDALWALMAFLILHFIFIKKTILWNGLAALMFAYLIEISQLYHAEWIDNVRNTTIGALILGHGFLWSDILAYTVGIGFGVGVFLFITHLKSRKNKF